MAQKYAKRRLTNKKGKTVYPYEVTTSENFLDMPAQTFAKNMKEARKYVKKRLRKGERIISIKRG